MTDGAQAATSTERRLRLLVVEDDESIAMGLALNLEAEGYEVESAFDGERGLELALGGSFDLVILDVMLPKLNGFEVLQSIRGRGLDVSIILLSARGAELDKVMGLELGAEDYITKPFGLAELLARVKVALRKGGRAYQQQQQALVIDPRTREVRRGGLLISMTATEFDVLWCLVEAAGRVVTRDEIFERVWGPGHHGTHRTIDNFLLQLRSKLEQDTARPRHLLTVRGVGYRFVP